MAQEFLKKLNQISIALLVSLFLRVDLYAKSNKEPVIINGDQVEYSTDAREATAVGNVEVKSGGAILTCQKITVNTETKDCLAEGGARIVDKNGVIEGEKITYNFLTKTGVILNADFRSNPYFGKTRKVVKVNENEFVCFNGYATTCSLNHPHYRISSKKINFFPKDKIQTKEDIFFLGAAPLLYLPQYNHSLRDPLMHVQVMPGKKKEWGPYVLSAWRYNLTEGVNGRIYADYREKLGVAEGFGLNYQTQEYGRGDFKYYYTQERSRLFREGQAAEFQRYLIRLRHKWDIDKKTNLIAEYYKIVDSKRAIYGNEYNFLKDYFYREYEKDAQPKSYLLAAHNFNYSSLNLLIQKRTNRWYDPGYVEKLPEITYSLPSYRMWDGGSLYFDDNSSLGNYNEKNTSTSTPATNSATADTHVNRLDTTNKLSLPMKIAFLQLKPFMSDRETFYSEDVNGSSVPPRTIFYTGADLSTKFYRFFNLQSNLLKLDLNGLRHIITPIISYTYNHEPTISNSRLRQIDDVDSVTQNNSATLELSNKLQTKRKGLSVDLVDFKITSNYLFKPKTGVKRGSNLSDILFKLKVLPYSWMRFDGDATLNRSVSRSDSGYNTFSTVNYDLDFDFAQERSFGIGQRYERKGSNQFTSDLKWRVSPKWKFSAYERFEIGHDPTLKRGLREQEYTITRDLHCWTADVTYNVKRGSGVTIWFILRLKAFPEMEFNFNQTYNAPKPGSQSNP